VYEPRHLSIMIKVTQKIGGPGVKRRDERKGGKKIRLAALFCLISQTAGNNGRMLELRMEGGWIPSVGLLPELCLLFGLADFKHDWGIPERQKNSGPRLGSQSKITNVFI
jgi:hypothetical protein